MSVDKVILRAVLSTLAAIGILFVFMISTLCIAFPSTMMGLTYNLGMESSCIHFAERAYKNDEDVYFIAYATEVAIEDEDNDKIFSCGKRFIENEDFSDFCSRQKSGYEEFICSQVCIAEYERGDSANALERAYDSLNGGFPKNNAVVALLMTAMSKQDAQTVQAIKEKLPTLSVGEDVAYLEQIIALAATF